MSSESTTTETPTENEPNPYEQMVLAAQQFLQQHQSAVASRINETMGASLPVDRPEITIDTGLDADLKPLFDAGLQQLALSLQTLRELRLLRESMEVVNRSAEAVPGAT